MINKALLNREVQQFIIDFEGDISRLAFSGSPFENVSVQELIQQIEGRKKIEKKLPLWFETPNILFPPKVNLEQTSSEITAKYKASLVRGKSLADITGGFGIDGYYFSKEFTSVHHFEINPELSALAAHNFVVLGESRIKCFNEDGLQAVLSKHYDVIFADPSRRHESKGKVFFLSDCEPNIPKNISEILDHCDQFLLKTSPMLDISVGLSELPGVAEIHIVAIDNEVKELLWLLKGNFGDSPKIKTIHFNKGTIEKFEFDRNEIATATHSLPQKYLYEPNAALLKSGAFDLISEKLRVNKLHKNTHLYTSETKIDFPGRGFLIEQSVPYSKVEMRKAISFKKANISTKNFPETVETLRNKWKIADGGNLYLFFVTNLENKKEMLICSKL